MLARIHIQLPFTLTIPKTETFTVWEYELEGYGVRIYPPLMSTTSAIPEGQQILINEQEAIQADILWIDFRKEEFDRDPQTACDPPYQTINSAANDFIERLRYVAKAPNIKQIELPYTSWNLTYLEDDEKELAEQEGLIRGRGARAFSFSWTALNQDVWNDVHELPPGWRPPVWQSLLLDANGALPEVGPSLVLAATALEVFISQTLDLLAEDHDTPSEIWDWIKTRDWIKKPSLDEQFDFLLMQFGGKSLKSEAVLWEGFKHLKNARNSFVHDGEPRIGNDLVTVDKARELLGRAVEITEFVKTVLPEQHQWPEFEHKFNLSLIQRIYQAEGDGT